MERDKVINMFTQLVEAITLQAHQSMFSALRNDPWVTVRYMHTARTSDVILTHMQKGEIASKHESLKRGKVSHVSFIIYNKG